MPISSILGSDKNRNEIQLVCINRKIWLAWEKKIIQEILFKRKLVSEIFLIDHQFSSLWQIFNTRKDLNEHILETLDWIWCHTINLSSSTARSLLVLYLVFIINNCFEFSGVHSGARKFKLWKSQVKFCCILEVTVLYFTFHDNATNRFYNTCILNLMKF